MLEEGLTLQRIEQDKMRNIRNPFVDEEDNHCFGCSPTNPYGLHLKFKETDDAITAEWLFTENYCGYHDILHGGIQACLMDEIASWYVFVKLKTGGVTASMKFRYLQPVSGIGSNIHLEARLIEQKHHLAFIEVTLSKEDTGVCTRAMIIYYLFPEKIAREKFKLPHPTAFYYSKEEAGKEDGVW
ncbi:MAG TPA: PaaI family thioesterase [Bacteroidales bacterium]|jgi:acyl-coenzyme A thioesterase PaaI-like protein|nr:PaaI family thioesterase [Bacteroidales bacterium]OQC61878.1 MAG: Thioesterase superfamily protein [Bacteroidetes bacterium ADurb.Bin012]HNV16871.1 PaaI family thioesterase [Bacteroidales bacterium]HNZ79730.1 PaaI family thioesterase [Bacteroidales bacterium]HOC16112.1 PaaI family thioesterase [Bacteroidales bacterium]